jgi:hypothetical protein
MAGLLPVGSISFVLFLQLKEDTHNYDFTYRIADV